MQIKDINNQDLQLVTDSQDVRALDEYLGQKFIDPHGYFVHVNDGDYDHVIYFQGTVPWLYKEVITIR